MSGPIQWKPTGPSHSNDFRVEPEPVRTAKADHENHDLMYKTAAVYMLSDWFGCAPTAILRMLTGETLNHNGTSIASVKEVEANINKRGRHNLRIDVRRS